MPIPVAIPGYSKLQATFGTTRFIDLEFGNDGNSGLTPAQAWKTPTRAMAVEFTPIIASNTTFDQLWVIAGVGRGNAPVDMNCFLGRIAAGAISRIGIRGWMPSDGARPGGGTVTRTIMRADTAFTTLTLVSGTIYKSNALPVGTAKIGQVLYKALQASQFDSDGCCKSHCVINSQGTSADATIATLLTGAGAYKTYYKTDTREVFVNVTGAATSTTPADWSWTPDDTAESWGMIRLSGFDQVSIQDITTCFGQRGIVVFDAKAVESYGTEHYEHATHGFICSYSNFALNNINIEDVSVWGLGKSSVGVTQIGLSGQSGNFNMFGVTAKRLRTRKYMLQNPGGANYQANYVINSLGIGTATQAGNGYVLPGGVVIEDSQFIDVNSAKVSPLYGSVSTGFRHTNPVDDTIESNYPVIFRRCYWRMLSGFYEGSSSGNPEELSHAYAFSNCRIDQKTDIPTMLATLGIRTAFVFDKPAGFASGGKSTYGLFNGTEWAIDIGNGDAAQRCAAVGYKTDNTDGNPCRMVVVNSTLKVKHSSTGQINMFDYTAVGTAGGVNLGLSTYCKSSILAYATPPGHPNNANLLCFQDSPATDNLGRQFIGCKYINVNQAGFSTSNTTFANWVANVDPTGVIGQEWESQDVDYIPGNIKRGARFIPLA